MNPETRWTDLKRCEEERDKLRSELETQEKKYEDYLQKLRDDWKTDVAEIEAHRNDLARIVAEQKIELLGYIGTIAFMKEAIAKSERLSTSNLVERNHYKQRWDDCKIKAEIFRDALKTLNQRMEVINGTEDSARCLVPGNCDNHKAMHKAREALGENDK